MFRLQRSLGQTLVPLVGFVALANLGCASSIAANHPHLDRRGVCLLAPGIELDATEWIYDANNNPISNFHPEVVDRVAPSARTVFEYAPNVDSSSTQYLPAPYNELQCPERFSVLPSRDAETAPLPKASFDLVVHEQRPEVAPQAITEKLANCVRQGGGQLKPITHTVKLNAYLTNDGQTVGAFVEQSTLGNRKIEACMASVLRTTSWPGKVEAVAAAPAAPVSRMFLAQPAPVLPEPDSGPESGIRQIQPRVGVRIPRIFVIPLNPLVAAAAVFGILYFWSDSDAPAWVSEMNPITRRQYTSVEEYYEVHRLSPQEILQRQQVHITNTQSQPPPAPSPAPAPSMQEQREQEKKAQQCAKLAGEIKDLITAERPATPPGGYPQGYQGLAKRWYEYATNEGKWGYTKEGNLGKKPANHLAEYGRQQNRLVNKLNDEWDANDKECEKMGHTLPPNARQYAAQKPQLGPGKPLVPAPTPTWPLAATLPVTIPAGNKGSKVIRWPILAQLMLRRYP